MEFKGFRHGVREVVCGTTSPLLNFVALEITKLRERSELAALDLIELGAVYVNEERCLNPNRTLESGDRVRIHTSPRRFASPVDLASRLLHEDDDSILVEKPADLPTEPVVDNVKENLLSFLEDLRGQRFFLVHRLALESEGLLLVAKSQEAAHRMSRAFTDGKVKRSYVAFLEAPLKIGSHLEGAMSIVCCEERRAETNLITEGRTTWLVVGAPLELCYRIELEFIVARPKEIRAYLATCGAPVVGDRVNGSRIELIDARLGKTAMAFRASSLSLAR